jgi:putative ABC transport system substrate-binding protein
MRRRDVIAGLSAVLAWRSAADVQAAAIPVVGFMSAQSPENSADLVAAFRRGLADGGYVDGRNVAIEFRWAGGDAARLPALAEELVGRPIAVLAAVGGEVSALAAQRATSRVPITFVIGGDPVEIGLVQSFNRPGRNVTGVTLMVVLIEAKRVGLLHELMPDASAIGALLNPDGPSERRQRQDVEAAARAIGRRLVVLDASHDAELEARFAAIIPDRPGALLVTASPYFDTRRRRIIAFAAEQRLPAIYHLREYPVAGGPLSYGPSIADGYRQCGLNAARILDGTKPADLPVQQAVTFELVINLKTAKALGIAVPPALLARADEVIE